MIVLVMMIVTICLGKKKTKKKLSNFTFLFFSYSKLLSNVLFLCLFLFSDNFDIDTEKLANLEAEKKRESQLKNYDIKFVARTGLDEAESVEEDEEDDDDMFAGALLDPVALAAREALKKNVFQAEESVESEPVAAWEQHTNGFGSKLLAKFGWKVGVGLGQKLEGRAVPIGIEGSLGRNGKPLDEGQCFGLGHYKRSKHGVPPPPTDAEAARKRARNNNKNKNVFDFLNKSLGDKKRRSTSQQQSDTPAKKKSKTVSELRSEVNYLFLLFFFIIIIFFCSLQK